MDGFFSKYNVLEDLKAAGFNVSGRLVYDLAKIAMGKMPWLGPKNEWYYRAIKGLVFAAIGVGLGYVVKQKVGRDAGLILSATVLGGVAYDQIVVPLSVKVLPASIHLGMVEVEDRALLGELTPTEQRLLLSDDFAALTVEDRQLGALTVENRRQLGDGDMGTSVEDDDNEVVLGGGFNMNHGSLAAVLSY